MDEKIIDLGQIFEIFKKRFIVIIIATILCGGASLLVSKFLITPQYTATASLYVYSNTNRENSITSSDLNASQELVNTYIVVLKSDTVLDQVISKMNLDLSAEYIRDNLTAKALDGTEAFSISVINKDPKLAQNIANMIVDIAPQEIIRVVKAGGVEVIDHAKEPLTPSSPNIYLNTLIGAVVGFIAVFGFYVILIMYDTKIHSEEDLKESFDIPVLGIIPRLEQGN